MVDRKWADWLHNPCSMEGAQHFKAGDKVSNGSQVGALAIYPLQSGVTNDLERGAKSTVGHKLGTLAT